MFEKNTIGSGTTAKSAATFCLIDDSVAHEFWSVRLFGFNFYTGLEERSPAPPASSRPARCVVAPYNDYEMYVLQAVDLTVASGYHAEYWRDHDKIRSIIPDLTSRRRAGRGLVPRRRLLRCDHDRQHPGAARARARRQGHDRHQGRRHRHRAGRQSPAWRPTRVTSISMWWSMPPARGRASRRRWSASSCRSGTPRPRSSSWLRQGAGLSVPGPQVPALLRAQGQGQRLHLQGAHDDGPQRPGACRHLGSRRAAHDGRHRCVLLGVPHRGARDDFPRLLESSIANEWVGYRAEPPDFLPVLGETPVEGYVLPAAPAATA